MSSRAKVVPRHLAMVGYMLAVALSFASPSTAAGFRPTPFAAAPTSAPAADYVLALSWEPAFCESAGRKPECRGQSASDTDARQLSLHGLWPDDEYCGVDGRLIDLDRDGDWTSLPAPTLSSEVSAKLDVAMPGTQSALERHEWLKHGTCSGLSADTYFSRAIALLDEVNGSGLGQLIASRVGQQIGSDALINATNRSFGTGAGRRLAISCRRDGSRELITELEFNLRGDITRDSLQDLLAKASTTSVGCRRGVIDPAGAQ